MHDVLNPLNEELEAVTEFNLLVVYSYLRLGL